jgi:hypothetical protein
MFPNSILFKNLINEQSLLYTGPKYPIGYYRVQLGALKLGILK